MGIASNHSNADQMIELVCFARDGARIHIFILRIYVNVSQVSGAAITAEYTKGAQRMFRTCPWCRNYASAYAQSYPPTATGAYYGEHMSTSAANVLSSVYVLD